MNNFRFVFHKKKKTKQFKDIDDSVFFPLISPIRMDKSDKSKAVRVV